MLELLLSVLLLSAEQTTTRPVIRVMGVGYLAIEQTQATPAQAQAYTYRAYVGSSLIPIVLTSVCGGVDGRTECMFPLKELNLTTTAVTVAITAQASAADGFLESERFVLPFDLLRSDRPATPGPFAAVKPGS
jgi:hypothetical protein